MTDEPQLKDPWLVAVWPGMGHVALAAGFYLMSKLEMRLYAQLSSRDLFKEYEDRFLDLFGPS